MLPPGTAEKHLGPRLGGLVFFLGLALLFSGPARADDLQVAIAAQALERFFQAAAPFHFKYELFAGAAAAEITLTNPRVKLEPGRPGRVFLLLDYRGQSKLLGLAPFSGQARPEVRFDYDPQRAALRVALTDFRIKAGPQTEIPLDGLIEPIYLPLTAAEPLRLDGEGVKTEVARVETLVTPETVRLLVDYRFTRVKLNHKDVKK